MERVFTEKDFLEGDIVDFTYNGEPYLGEVKVVFSLSLMIETNEHGQLLTVPIANVTDLDIRHYRYPATGGAKPPIERTETEDE